jgi:hypothetical protein
MLARGVAFNVAIRHRVLCAANTRRICARRLTMTGGGEHPPVPAKCVGCEGLTETLSKTELAAYEGVLGAWSLDEEGKQLTKLFRANNFSVRCC